MLLGTFGVEFTRKYTRDMVAKPLGSRIVVEKVCVAAAAVEGVTEMIAGATGPPAPATFQVPVSTQPVPFAWSSTAQIATFRKPEV